MPEQQDIMPLLASDDPDSIREGARLAGVYKCKEAISALVQHIRSKNIGVQEAVERALRKIGGPEVVHAILPFLRSEEAPVRNIAMDLLRALGHADIEGISALLTDDDPDIRIFIADILGSVGRVMAVPPLCKALLHDPEVNVRYQAAVSLGDLAYLDAVPSLNKAMADEEWVQFAVVEALAKIGADSSIMALAKALNTATDLLASMIVDALAQMGNMKAIPLLLKRLETSSTPLCNKIVRAVVAIMGEESLRLLGAADCERLRGHMEVALNDEDPEIQDAAIKGFAALGGAKATAHILRLVTMLDKEKDACRFTDILGALVKMKDIPELEKGIRSGNEQVAQVAAEALMQVDAKKGELVLADVFWQSPRDLQRFYILELAEYAGSELQDFFLDVIDRHEDGNVIRGALGFLGRKGNPEQVEGKVLGLLLHPYNDVKEAALDACIHLRTPRIEAHFTKMMQSEDPVQRMMGIYALSFFATQAFMSVLQDALHDPSADVRRVAVESLGRDCSFIPERIPLLEEAMHDESQDVRMAVVDVLGGCSGEGIDVALMKLLDDQAPWVQARCIKYIGERKMTKAIEPLVTILGNENHLLVIKAIEALGKIGGESAFRALLPFLDHQDHDLQEAAENAINSIRQHAGE